MKTFRIYYEGLDNYGEVEFCSNTEEEALELFKTWCLEDNHCDPVPVNSIERVYDYYDAIEYAGDYEEV